LIQATYVTRLVSVTALDGAIRSGCLGVLGLDN